MKLPKLFSLFFSTFLVGLIFFTTPIFAQKRRAELEREKQENQRKIEETNRILEETRSKKTVTLGQLNVISEQIKEKNNVISIYEREISLIEYEIFKIENSINVLSQQLADLKKEYAIMIYSASKSNDAYNKLMFLFSAKDFNEVMMRLKSFKFYSQSRKKQANQIKNVAIKLRNQRKNLYAKRIEKSTVLASIRNESINLKSLKGKQESTISSLSQQESQLMKELDDRKKAVKKLDNIITDLIKKEMEKAAANAANAALSEKKNRLVKEAEKLSGSFSNNKAKLFWPVEHGFISSRFGKHKHPVFHHVTVENLGVDIQTRKGEFVRSVFDGTVIAVTEVPGMNSVVMIQHGEYYTFYAKLRYTLVKPGQKVKAKEYIGEVFTNEDEVSEVQFQVWKGNEKQDPQSWLYDR